MLGLPGLVNHADEMVSGFLAALNSTMKNIGNIPLNDFILKSKAHTVVRSLLSGLSELEKQGQTRGSSQWRNEVRDAVFNFCCCLEHSSLGILLHSRFQPRLEIYVLC